MANIPEQVQIDALKRTASSDVVIKTAYNNAVNFLASKGYSIIDMPPNLIDDIYNYYTINDKTTVQEREKREAQYDEAVKTAEAYEALLKKNSTNEIYQDAIGKPAMDAIIAVCEANAAQAIADAEVATAAVASAKALREAGELCSIYPKEKADDLAELKKIFSVSAFADKRAFSSLDKLKEEHIANLKKSKLQEMIYEKILKPYSDRADKKWYSFYFFYSSSLDLLRTTHSRMVEALLIIAKDEKLYEPENEFLLQAMEQILRDALDEYKDRNPEIVNNILAMLPKSKDYTFETLRDGRIKIGSPAMMALIAENTKLKVEIQAKDDAIAAIKTKIASDRIQEENRAKIRELGAIARDEAREKSMQAREKERDAAVIAREENRFQGMLAQFKALKHADFEEEGADNNRMYPEGRKVK